MESPKPKPPSASAGSSTRRAFRRLARRGRRYALPWLSIGRWHKRLLLGGASFMALMVLWNFGFSPEAMFAKAVEIKTGLAVTAGKTGA